MRCAIVPILLAACRASSAGPAISWQAPVEIAHGGGTKGAWHGNESRYDFVDDPSVALAADGTPYVVWVDHRDRDVHLRTINISRSPATFSWLPRVVVDGSRVYAIWQEIVFVPNSSHGGDIFFARSLDGGATFEPPIDLSRYSIEGDGKARITKEIWHNGSLDLAVSRRGLVAAWTNYEGALLVAESRDGAQWSAPRKIAGSRERPARAPSLAVGEHVYLAWTYGEDASADVHLATDFGEPVVIATTPTYSDAPKLAVDDRGTLHVAFAETTGDAFATSRVVYTRSRDGRTFEPPRTLSRDEASFPHLAVDGTRVAVAWEAGSGTRRTARGLGLAVSEDRGAHFTEHAIPGSRDAIGVNGSEQGRLMDKLALRGRTIAVVNSALRPGESSRVWLIRGHLQTSR